MRKILLVASVLCFISVSSCKKSDSTASYKCTACTTTPDAKAAYDNSSKGVYKGTVVGSTGTIKFNIGNNDSTITATMVIDGTTVTLTASVAWVSGSAYVSPFTGTMGGSAVSITFSVGSDGSNPLVVTANIPGHPGAMLNVTKETSTNLIMCFEGTYQDNSSSGDKGTLNLFLSEALKAWKVTSKSTVDTSSHSVISGTFSNNVLSYSDGSGGSITGTLSGDQITGTYVGKNNGTWTVKRTL